MSYFYACWVVPLPLWYTSSTYIFYTIRLNDMKTLYFFAIKSDSLLVEIKSFLARNVICNYILRSFLFISMSVQLTRYGGKWQPLMHYLKISLFFFLFFLLLIITSCFSFDVEPKPVDIQKPCQQQISLPSADMFSMSRVLSNIITEWQNLVRPARSTRHWWSHLANWIKSGCTATNPEPLRCAFT